MGNVLRDAINQKKQQLIEKLIASGVYKKDSKHLFEWTISELEKEYRFIKKMKP
ncbi:Fur-regulated basic protein FbpA [Ectobacillus antri]|uniref:Fur-regulated basic protein FbpA n=1 Tax=Ectobacillus antri TaxID=2486280 RepID=A0ABT6HA68_9BACI|nr:MULTISPECIES: Fur-regulated basic protein FbpA [Ectobacillus]MDG4658150.1 Fur-regulated basic protein FbpA [Ectobacillus antri]MDG5755256.1 Fur-regulated basic protein FbpA [Ectobacillus antri]UOY94579.1 Fur-regulated basic protein FbpA [Ectobacillus sp. JY-23]